MSWRRQISQERAERWIAGREGVPCRSLTAFARYSLLIAEAEICAVFVSSFRYAGTVDPTPLVPVCDGRRLSFPFVLRKKTGRVIVPVPVPRFSEAYPIPRR